MGGADFSRLDERCVTHILSFTSPRDVCRLSAVCRKFHAAAGSEAPWEKFLPPDWWKLIPKSISPLHFTSKKELFFRLSKPFLIDDGSRAFWLDKASGKKCFLLSTKALKIPYRVKKLQWCKWTAAEASIFPEVLEWTEGLEVDLQGTIDMADLSPNTMYAVRFVVGLPLNKQAWKGRVELSLQAKGQNKQERIVSLNTHLEGHGLQACMEFDGWNHVEVGKFFCNGDGGTVEFRIHQVETLELKFGRNGAIEFVEVIPSKWRMSFTSEEEIKVPVGGLIIMGIEVSPSTADSKSESTSSELHLSGGLSASISEVSPSIDAVLPVQDESATGSGMLLSLCKCFRSKRL